MLPMNEVCRVHSMTSASDTSDEVSVSPFVQTSSSCSVQLSGHAYCLAQFIGLAVTTLGLMIGVWVLWSTMAIFYSLKVNLSLASLCLGD